MAKSTAKPDLFGQSPLERKKSVALRGPTIPEPTNLYDAILRAAGNPKVDATKLKVLTEVQIEVEDREARKAFTRAFNALQSELPAIDKDGYIDHGEGFTKKGNVKLKASYSTYPNLMRVCKPLLRKHGFTFNNIIEPSANDARIVIVGYLTHVEGHEMISRFPLSIDDGPGRSNAQAWGSSSSYGKRYNLILMLDIVSERPGDQDDDARPRDPRVVPDQVQPTKLSKAQTIQLSTAIDDCGVGLDKFLGHYSIEKIDDLDPAQFREALTSCANYKEESRRRAAKAQESSAPH